MLIIAVYPLRKTSPALFCFAQPAASGGCTVMAVYCISWFWEHSEMENFRSSCKELFSSRRWRCNLINKHQTNWEGKPSKISPEIRNCRCLKNGFDMDLVNFIFLDKLLKLSVKTGLLQSSVSILCKLFLSFTSAV